MAFEYRPGVREKTSVLISLAGSTGSGKTFTALLMGFGLAYPECASPAEILAAIKDEGRSRVCVIDTEGGRALHYAPGPGQNADFTKTFQFEYAEITAPFDPKRYEDAVVGADQAGFAVVIVDSMSHEYESEGGILEWADRLAEGVPKEGIENPEPWKREHWIERPVKSPGNWKKPKMAHKRMMNRFIQCRCHMIFCLRAEEKMKLNKVKDERSGKERTEVIAADDRPLLERWEPICEKRFMFEMTVSFLLLASSRGVGIPVKLEEQHRPLFPEGQQIGMAAGRALSDWSHGGAEPSTRSAPPSGGNKRTPEQMVDAYEQRVRDCMTQQDLQDLQADAGVQKFFNQMKGKRPELHDRIMAVNAERYQELSG